MPKSIKIADDIYEYVQSKAIAFEDDFNSALRRLLGISEQIVPRKGSRKTRHGGVSTEELELPLLAALVKIGGSGRKAEIAHEIEKWGILGPEDMVTISSNRILWLNRLDFSRQNLIKTGEMLSDSPVGVWEISPKGRARVERERGSF